MRTSFGSKHLLRSVKWETRRPTYSAEHEANFTKIDEWRRGLCKQGVRRDDVKVSDDELTCTVTVRGWDTSTAGWDLSAFVSQHGICQPLAPRRDSFRSRCRAGGTNGRLHREVRECRVSRPRVPGRGLRKASLPLEPAFTSSIF